MSALLGKSVSMSIELPDGRNLGLGDALCTSLEISSFSGMNSYLPGDIWDIPKQSSVEVTAKFLSNCIPMMTAPDDYESHSGFYCLYCYSDWIPGSRGNCGACGAPKRAAKSYDGDDV